MPDAGLHDWRRHLRRIEIRFTGSSTRETAWGRGRKQRHSGHARGVAQSHDPGASEWRIRASPRWIWRIRYPRLRDSSESSVPGARWRPSLARIPRAAWTVPLLVISNLTNCVMIVYGSGRFHSHQRLGWVPTRCDSLYETRRPGKEEASAARWTDGRAGRGRFSGGLAAGNGVAEAFEEPFDSSHPLADVRSACFQDREPPVVGSEPRVLGREP